MRPLPRGPVLDWDSWRGLSNCPLPCVDELPNGFATSSGRAALHQALRVLKLEVGSDVLVPSYHCPTMIAPLVELGLRPQFYALRPDGLPDLSSIPQRHGQYPGAFIVAHYFGFGQALRDVRRWCDDRGVALIEDCAHALVGWAGERPIGHWGDLATASLTKFFPVYEAGWLGSATRSLDLPTLHSPSIKDELRASIGILDRSARAERLFGLGWIAPAISRIRGQAGHMPRHERSSSSPSPETKQAEPSLESIDMSRAQDSPARFTRLLIESLPRARIVGQRQANYDRFSGLLRGLPRTHSLVPVRPKDAVPYAYPLLIDRPDSVYRTLREQGLAVLRWDQLWPGTPKDSNDTGKHWSRHLLQFLCHQDLRASDIDRTVAALISAMREHV